MCVKMPLELIRSSGARARIRSFPFPASVRHHGGRPKELEDKDPERTKGVEKY